MLRAPWIALVAFAFAGCSLTQLDRSDCTENVQCQQGLGAAFVCQAGYCASSREVTCSSDFNCSELGSHFRCESGVCEPASDVLCSDHPPCVAEFGVGGFCSPSGFCADRAETPKRCELTYPSDLLDNPTAYIDHFIIGAIVIGDRDTRTARARAVELAVRVVNETPGFDPDTKDDVEPPPGLPGGVPVGLVACTSQQDEAIDALSSSRASLDVANYLVNEVGARVIIGPQTSANTLSVFDALDGGALLISPSATSGQLIDADNPKPDQETPGLLWRTPVTDVHQAPELVSIMTACDHQKVGIVYKDDAYGQGLADLVEQGLAQEEIEYVSFPYSTIAGQTNAQQDLVDEEDIDVVLFIDAESARIVSFLGAMQGVADWAGDILLPDSGAIADAIAGIESVSFVESVRGTRPSSAPGPLFEDFQATFGNFFRTIDRKSTIAVENNNVAFVAQAYDATWLAMYGTAWAIQREVDVSPITIARGIRKLSDEKPGSPGGAPTKYDVGAADWANALHDLAGGNSIDIQGASSRLDYNLKTEELRFSEDEDVIEVYRYVSDGSGGYNIVADIEAACPFP